MIEAWLRRIRSRIMRQRSSAFWEALTLGSGSFAAQLLQAGAVPVLSRLYSPAAFGVLSVVQGVAALGSAFGGLRYELAIVLAPTDAEARAVLRLQLVLSAASAFLATIVVVPFRQVIAEKLGIGDAAGWLAIVPVVVFLTAAGLAATYWLMRRNAFKRLALFRFVQSGSTVGLQLAAGLPGAGTASGLLAGFVFGLATPFAILKRSKPHDPSVSCECAPSLRDVARKYVRFPLYVVPYGLLGAAREHGFVLLLAYFAGAKTVGLFSLALRLLYTPVGLVAGSVGPVLYRRGAGAANPAEVADLVNAALRKLIIWATPVIVSFVVLAPIAISIILGREWLEATQFVVVMGGPALTLLLSGVLARMFDLVGKQEVALMIEGTYSVVCLVAVVVAFALFDDLIVGIAVFAVVTMLYHLVWIWTVYASLGFASRPLIGLGLRALAIAGATALVIHAVLAFLASGLRIGGANP